MSVVRAEHTNDYNDTTRHDVYLFTYLYYATASHAINKVNIMYASNQGSFILITFYIELSIVIDFDGS